MTLLITILLVGRRSPEKYSATSSRLGQESELIAMPAGLYTILKARFFVLQNLYTPAGYALTDTFQRSARIVHPVSDLSAPFLE